MRKGFSLLETLIAVFILICAFCVFAALQNFSLVQSARAERRTVAARLARNRLEALRAWANQGTNFDTGNWAALANPVDEAGFPGFQTSVHDLAGAIYSPSTSLADPADPLDLSPAVRRVRVQVAYGSEKLDVISQVGAPRGVPYTPLDQAIQVVVVNNSPVPVGQALNLTARARDENLAPLMGMVYKWGVLPGTGTGTVVKTNASGSQAQFINEIRTPAGVLPNPAPGPRSCRVIATAYYAGKELKGTSAVITVQTP